MKVLVDGIEVKVLNDVKVIWENVETAYGDVAELHLFCNYEGVVIDSVDKEGTVTATQCLDHTGLFEGCR